MARQDILRAIQLCVQDLDYQIAEQLEQLSHIEADLAASRSVRRRLRDLLEVIKTESVPKINVLSEQESEVEGMPDRITFEVKFEAQPDVASREVEVFKADGTTSLGAGVLKVPAGAVGPFVADQDEWVRIVVVNVDDAGNRSVRTTYDLQVLDTIAPPAPGMPVIHAISEEEGDQGSL